MIKNRERVSIVGGGKVSQRFLSAIMGSDYVIGVDRGAWWLLRRHIVPDIAIGDFDSVNARELLEIKKKVKRIEKHPKKKNKTDMELAVEHAIGMHPKEVMIYGAVGDRLDHSVANIHLLEQLDDKGIKGIIRDERNEIRIVTSQLKVKKDVRFQYISILSVTEAVEVTLAGFAYDLSHAIIHRGQTLGISNEIRADEATIKVHSGKALVIRSRD